VSDTAAILARHAGRHVCGGGDGHVAIYDDGRCDTAIVLAALDAEITGRDALADDEQALSDALDAARYREARLRAALTFMPDVKFTNLPGLTAPDILIAIAAWMDKVDGEADNTNHDVQQHLRRWAAVMMDALATEAE
jgi:hypothetical protein